MILMLMLSCAISRSSKVIGFVDKKDGTKCTLQLVDEETLFLNSSLCKKFKEGDVIKVKRLE